VAAKQGAGTGITGEAVMAENTQSAGGTRTRLGMTPHDMLAASARLGSYAPRGRAAPRAVPTQQYDESGFPIRADRASFARRVRQLLRG
jgi:hypothetical protein